MSALRDHAFQWAKTQALPLWAEAGYEAATGLFYERLNFDGSPIHLPARRLMVQARQIATYSRAVLYGYYKPTFDIQKCLASMAMRYRECDGAPGWIFSIGPNLEPVDTTRDLYAHAFVLYALAWSYKVLHDKTNLSWANELLLVLDQRFLGPDGAYVEAIPAKDGLRRQNPHMHLLEALLAMAEASQNNEYLDRAAKLAEFALQHFLDPETGLLLEEHNSDWTPAQPPGGNRVEPGHLFEWAWLLRECDRLNGKSFETVIEQFLSFATKTGTDIKSGLIFDAVSEKGKILEVNSRLWPHAEAIKAHVAQKNLSDEINKAQIDHYFSKLFTVFALPHLGGGWIDRVKPDGTPLVDFMPTSSLYHIMSAIFEACANDDSGETR